MLNMTNEDISMRALLLSEEAADKIGVDLRTVLGEMFEQAIREAKAEAYEEAAQKVAAISDNAIMSDSALLSLDSAVRTIRKLKDSVVAETVPS